MSWSALISLVLLCGLSLAVAEEESSSTCLRKSHSIWKLAGKSSSLKDYVLDQPIQANFTICPAYEGGLSCCSQNATNYVENMFTVIITFLSSEEQNLTAVTNAAFDIIQTNLDAEWKNLTNYLNVLDQNSEVKEQLKAFNITVDQLVQAFQPIKTQFDALITILRTHINSYIEASFTCYKGYNQYLAGMYCLACNPNATNWVLSNSGKVRVKLHNETCTFFADKCLPYYTEGYKFEKAMKEWTKNLTKTFDTVLAVLKTSIKGKKVSNKDSTMPCTGSDETEVKSNCKEYICKKMILGFREFELDRVDFSRYLEGVGNLLDNLDFGLSFPGMKSRGLVDGIHDGVNKLISFRSKTVRDDISISNEYSTEGYPATQVGKSSLLVQSSESPAATLSLAFSLLALVGSSFIFLFF